MKKIDILYNPYTQRAGITIEGLSRDAVNGRLREFLVGKSIEQWLPRHVISYQRWEGALPELMDYLNDDELEIRFCGIPSDYQIVERELKAQESTAEEKGFDASLYRLSFREQWKPEKICGNIVQFIGNRISFVPVQKEMMEMEYLGEQMENAEGVTVEELRLAREKLLKITEELIRICGKEEYGTYRQTWENAHREAEQIFD